MRAQGILRQSAVCATCFASGLQAAFDSDLGKLLMLEDDVLCELAALAPDSPARCRTASPPTHTRRLSLTWHPQRARRPRHSGCRSGAPVPQQRRELGSLSKRCRHWRRGLHLGASLCAPPSGSRDVGDACSWQIVMSLSTSSANPLHGSDRHAGDPNCLSQALL